MQGASSGRWYRGLAVVVTPLLVVFVGVLLVLPWIERKMIYFPDTRLYRTPTEAGIGFEDVQFAAADGTRLHGWFVPARSAEVANGRALLLSHGNAGNIADRVEWIAMLHRGLDAHILAYDYRGFGRSEGEPSEEGLYADADAALATLRAREAVDPAKICVIGRSLGGGVTAELAVRAIDAGAPPAAVVLESTFTSMGALAGILFPAVPGLGRLIRTGYDNLGKVPRIRAAGVPIVVVHGGVDELIPVAMGHTLATAAGVAPVIIERGGHNDAWYVGGEQRYLPPLRAVLSEL